MSILLTDEEIKEVETIHEHYWELDISDLRTIAKAQLKKVVEWLEGYHVKVLEGNPSDTPAVYSDCGYHIPTKAMQALLKECE